MKIALIQTIPAGQARSQVGIGIACLQSYTLKNEENVDIDLFLNDGNFEREFKPIDYDLVGISSVTSTFQDAIELAKQVKMVDGNIPVLIGGSHISGFTKSILNKCFDVGVIGEGEETFLDLVRLYKRSYKFAAEKLTRIKGICFTQNDNVVFTGYREFIKNIDTIPHVDLNFFRRYNALAFTATSRGCPYDCKYCNSRTIWRNKLRFHSPEYVINDIKRLMKLYPEDHRLLFKDDTFTANKKVLYAIRERYEEITADKELMIIGSSHVNFINHEIGKLLNEIGVKKLNFGIESGSDRLMRIVKRNNTDLKRTEAALDICYEYGIVAGSSFLIGVPEETEDDLRRSYEFIIEKMITKRLLTAGTLILTPLPREDSDYWQLAIKKYNIDHKIFDWRRLDIRSWHFYRFENNNVCSINDWWNWRKSFNAVYIGGLPEEKWLKIIEPYEVELMKLNEVNIVIDRSMH